jgi:hypothetical protein
MFKSNIIEFNGHFVGVAVTAANGLRFIAVDPRVADLDGSVWPSLADVQRLVSRELNRGAVLPNAAEGRVAEGARV